MSIKHPVGALVYAYIDALKSIIPMYVNMPVPWSVWEWLRCTNGMPVQGEVILMITLGLGSVQVERF